MIKGIQKKLIMMQLNKNDMFEGAYFIVRDDKEAKISDKNDMVKEANRIINECVAPNSRAEKRSGRLGFFALGAMIGILLSSSISLVIFKLIP